MSCQVELGRRIEVPTKRESRENLGVDISRIMNWWCEDVEALYWCLHFLSEMRSSGERRDVKS